MRSMRLFCNQRNICASYGAVEIKSTEIAYEVNTYSTQNKDYNAGGTSASGVPSRMVSPRVAGVYLFVCMCVCMHTVCTVQFL